MLGILYADRGARAAIHSQPTLNGSQTKRRQNKDKITLVINRNGCMERAAAIVETMQAMQSIRSGERGTHDFDFPGICAHTR